MKHLHKLAKLSPSFSPEVRICLRSYIAPRFSTSVLGVWKHDETLVRVFDILHATVPKNNFLNVQ